MDPSDRERLALAGVVFAVLFSQVLLYPGVPQLVAELGAEAGTSPLATTEIDASMWFLVAEFAAYVAFVGVWGVLSDRAGRRVPFVIAGAIGAAIGYVALALVPSVPGLGFEAALAIRVAQGAMTIGAFSLAITMLMDLEGGHGRNMGAAGIAIGLGAALGAPVGGQLTDVTPIAPLLGAATLMVLVAGAMAFVPDRAPTGRRTARAIVDRVRRTPTLSVPYAFGFVDRLTAGFFALVGTLYFQQEFGLSAGETGLMLACFFAPFALLQYPMGVLSDRIGRAIPIVVGSLWYGVGIMVVGWAPSVPLAALSMVFVGVLGALVAPATMALVTDLAGAGERGVAMAGFNLAGSVGFLAGFLVGGGVASVYGFPPAFLVAGGLEVLIAVGLAPVFVRLGLGAVSSVDGTGRQAPE